MLVKFQKSVTFITNIRIYLTYMEKPAPSP